MRLPPEDVVWESIISRPVRFWSREGGADEGVLQALAERRFGDLPRVEIPPERQREQAAGELAAAFGRLRALRDSYWDQQWRREHRGFGRYPENVLWEAVEGYLDLYDASQADPGQASRGR